MANRRARPVLPALPGDMESAVDRFLRAWRKDPEEALSKFANRGDLLSLLRARLAAEKAAEGDAAGALAEARAAACPGAMKDAVAAALLSAAGADGIDGADAERLLLECFETAQASVARGAALARLALLYRDRSIPLGFRFYAPRALRVLDRGNATGLHPAVDLDAARLATAVLEYHHRRDEPERSGRAFAVLDRVREADPFTTVQGLKYHGVALGKLQEWEASSRIFSEAAKLAEDRDLRGCDGVFVYAAAVKIHEKDSAGAKRLLSKVHIRRLDKAEKLLYRQFRHLVEAAAELKPLSEAKAEKFLRAQKRRARAAEKQAAERIAAEGGGVPMPAEAPAPPTPAKKKPARRKAAKKSPP